MGQPTCWLLARVEEFKIPTQGHGREAPSQSARFGHSRDPEMRPSVRAGTIHFGWRAAAQNRAMRLTNWGVEF